MIVYTETPDEYRKRVARKAKRKAARKRRDARKAERKLQASLPKPAKQPYYPKLRAGDDWWNNLKEGAPC